MDSIIFHEIRLQNLRHRLEICRKQCAALSADYDGAATAEQKATIGYQWECAIKESHAAQYLLELWEQQGRELDMEQHMALLPELAPKGPNQDFH